MKEKIRTVFAEIVGTENVFLQEPMEKHTTFRIGGPADYYLCPRSKEEVRKLCEVCREFESPSFILGNGSNLLVSDKGYRGAVIQIYKNMNAVSTEGNRIHAQAGALLSAVSNHAMKNGLAGMEFASGIPGTLGGAVVMNAGAYGGEMKDILESVLVMEQDGTFSEIPAGQLKMGYRTSIIKEKGCVVLEAVLRLYPDSPEAIKLRMDELKEKRIAKQPLEYPSAGSTFKRPEGYYAGKLIMDAGLCGYRVGGAQVSEKHCGFVINRERATAADVLHLMKNVQEIVESRFSVQLEPEVKFLGEW